MTCEGNHFCVNGAATGTTLLADDCGCNCEGTMFEGDMCEVETTCEGNHFCANGVLTGTTLIDGCGCNCEDTMFEGDMCEVETTCDDAHTCVNGAIIGGTLINGCGCDCTGTDFEGDMCEDPIISPWQVANFESVTLYFREQHEVTMQEKAMMSIMIRDEILEYALENCTDRRLRGAIVRRLEDEREIVSIENKYTFQGNIQGIPPPVQYSKIKYWKLLTEVLETDDKDLYNGCIKDRWADYFAADGGFNTNGVAALCAQETVISPEEECVWLGTDYSIYVLPTDAPTATPFLPPQDGGGINTAAIVGISSAGALVALLTFGFLTKKRKRVSDSQTTTSFELSLRSSPGMRHFYFILIRRFARCRTRLSAPTRTRRPRWTRATCSARVE